jgi:hypothetical protein
MNRIYNYRFIKGIVEYYDPTSNQSDLSVFHKTSDYSYQKEFRYLIEGNCNEPLRIEIGALSDIAEICETNKVDGLKFDWKD